MPSLIGTKSNQIPTVGDLGTLAFQDASNPKLGTVVANGLTVDTTTLVVDTVNDRVGIGTASPAQKLDVTGGIRSSNGGNENIFITDGTNTASLQQTGAALYFNSNTNTTGGSFIWRNSSSYTTVMTLNANGALALQGGASANGVGITFPATQSASSDANTLDDYEEGTWTPVVFSGVTDATMSGDNQGRYTKVGRAVTIQAYIQTTTLNGLGGGAQLSIKGLPFAIPAVFSAYGGTTAGQAGNLNITAGQSVGVYPEAGTSRLTPQVWTATTGTTTMTASQWSDDGYITISLTYFV
jgi:hypothetical protein